MPTSVIFSFNSEAALNFPSCARTCVSSSLKSFITGSPYVTSPDTFLVVGIIATLPSFRFCMLEPLVSNCSKRFASNLKSSLSCIADVKSPPVSLRTLSNIARLPALLAYKPFLNSSTAACCLPL